MALLPSDAWMAVFVERINGSPDYRAVSGTWEGDIAFVFEAEPDKGVSTDLWARLDLWHGECLDGGMVSADVGRRAAYVIRAPYSLWKVVLRGDLDPVRAMMQGKLKLQGDLPTIVRYARAANELVRLAMTVPTEFLDERPPRADGR